MSLDDLGPANPPGGLGGTKPGGGIVEPMGATPLDGLGPANPPGGPGGTKPGGGIVEPMNQPAWLPTIPPRPSDQAPEDTGQHWLWSQQWTNYRWAVQMHSDEACRQSQAQMRVALIDAIDAAVGRVEAALANRRQLTRAEVVLAMSSVVPVAIRSTEHNWTDEVIKVADVLWAKMQRSG